MIDIAMANQVSQSELTLLEAIQQEIIAKPEMMRWNAFQTWRKGPGRRPGNDVDGVTTTTIQETALWKSVMLEFYGDSWAMDLASSEVEPR